MFVSPDVTLPASISTALDEFAANNAVEATPKPIRVQFGRFRVTTPGPWTAEEAEACGTNPEFAQEHGTTIIVWGSASPQTGREWHSLPGAFYTDNVERELEVRDTIVPTSGVRQAIPYHIGGDDAPDVGEFLGNTLWLFMNISYLPDPDMLDVESMIIEPLRRSMNPDIMNEFRTAQAEISAQAYADMMSDDPERRVQDQRGRIDEQAGQITMYERQILETRQRLDLQRRELEQIMSTMQVPVDHWKKEWMHITRHPMIAPDTLTMVGQTVQYDTILLNINTGSTEIPLGRMRININMESGAITIKNLNNARRNRDHPHIANGDPCWGGYHAEVMDHVINNRLSALVEFLFGYLQSYNPQDEWGNYIQYWTDAPELLAA